MNEKIRKGSEFLIADISEQEVFVPEEFSDEQKQMGETTRKYVTDSILPDVEEIDEQNFDLVVNHLKQLGELGLFLVDAPEEYGGLELDKVTSALIAENIAPSGAFSVVFSAHTGIGTLPLVYYGSKDQKQRYLEKLITGEWIGAYCLTEPNSGSDAMGAKSTAKLSGDGKHYILNGTKQFITNAGYANLFTVFAKIDGDKFTAFLVEREHPGLTIDQEEKKLGIKGSSTCALIMDNLRVPVENLLGEIGKGHKIAFNILNVGRFKLGAAVCGASKSAIRESVIYAKERKQFKLPIASFGAIQEKLCDMTTQTFASESMIYRIAALMDQKLETLDKKSPTYYQEYEKSIEDYTVECAISKVYCSDVLAFAVDEMVQIFGGYGYVKGYPAERYYRDERINRIFEGTNEINRLLIAGTILKKAEKNILPIQQAAMQAGENLITPDLDEIDLDVPFSGEKVLVRNLKQIFLIVSGFAVQRYGEKISFEQELLMAAANIAIQLFALESAVLRAAKIYEQANENKKKLLRAITKSLAFEIAELLSAQAKKAAFFLEEGDDLMMLLSGIRRFTKFDASGLLESKRFVAKSVIEAEKYPF